jgi:glyoxylase-like metal-dependent hydrolase (beta-lactamase superfamily II)
VYLPKEKVLCTGDAAVNGPYNFVGDGNIGNWPNVVAKAQKLAVEHVLPGHGPSGGKEILANQRLFFVELNKQVAAAVKQGKKRDDIVKMEGDRAVSTTLQMPEGAKVYVGPDFAGQVLAAYKEVTQKKPSGDLPH